MGYIICIIGPSGRLRNPLQNTELTIGPTLKDMNTWKADHTPRRANLRPILIGQTLSRSLLNLVSLAERIPTKDWRALWDAREADAFRKPATAYLLFFGSLYIAHLLLIDLPSRKEPIGLYIGYRLGLAILAFICAFFTHFPSPNLSGYLLRLPLAVAALNFGYWQAESMVWRSDVPFGYSVYIPVVSSLFLRISPAGTAIFLVLAFTLAIPAWLSRPDELRFILSAALVGLASAVAFRTRMISELEAFIAQQRYLSAEAEKQLALVRLSEQVAHDIRSPLAALEVATLEFHGNPSVANSLVTKATKRIHSIMEDLLSRNQASRSAYSCVALPMIEEIITEKRAVLERQHSLAFDLQVSESASTVCICVEPTTFKRVLSNLIDNAVEALSGHGNITVSVWTNSTQLFIAIKDDGKGIPPELVDRIGTRGFSTKQDNHNNSVRGLGIYHARQSIQAWNGELSISSSFGEGATVTLTLPLSVTPPGFALA